VTFTTNQGTSIAGSRVIAPTQSNVGNNGVVPGGAACYYNFFTGFNDYLHWLKNHPQNADGYPISWYAYAGFPKQNYNCRLKVIGENNNYAITLSNFYDSLEQPNICDFTGSHGNAVSGTVTYGANSVIFNNGPGFSYSNNPPPAGPFPCLGNWTDLTLFSASWKGTGNISVSGDLGTPQYLATVASVLYSVSAAMGCGYLGSDAYFNNQMCTDTFFKSVTPAELPANCFQYSLFGGQPKTNFFNQYWQVLAQQGGQAAGYVVPFHDRFPLLKALLYWPTPSDTATWYLGSVSAPPPPPGPCQSDFDHSGLVDSNDLTILLGAWGTSGQGQYDADVDNDGFVGPSDLVHTLAAFGESGIKVPSWATAIQYQPDPTVVTDSALLQRIENACYAWQVYDNQSQVKMVLVPDGSFQMGCIPSDQSPCQPDESPTHTVTLSKPFYMSQTEVTQAQWHAQTQSNPSYHQGDLNPVERVSWDGLNTFLKTSPGMRLPTEAEWEYAYLAAGTTTKAFHGFVNPQAGGVSRPDGTNDETLVGNIAWYLGNSSSQTHAVAGKFANGLGLYDMSGNVWEWVYDCYGPYTPASQTDPTGPTGSCPSRVLRGGSYSYSAANLRASNRDSFTSGSSDADIGFRVVKDVD
jgi:formylglycine-generating enzyme required for sulfatase activity